MSAPTTRLVYDWVWVAPSGRRLTAPAVGAHLDNAAATLRRNGWNPGLRDTFGMFEAIGGVDFQRVAGRFIDVALADEAGSDLVDYVVWEQVPGRTLDEVLGLLGRASQLVRSQIAGAVA